MVQLNRARGTEARETGTDGSIVNAAVVSHSYVGGNPIRIETQEATASRQLRLWLPLAGGILFPDERHAQSH
jgi:iron(III) transport system ATP-binding protein